MSSSVEIGKGVLEKQILNIVNVFLLFGYYTPLETCMALHLTNFNPLHPNMLYAKFG